MSGRGDQLTSDLKYLFWLIERRLSNTYSLPTFMSVLLNDVNLKTAVLHSRRIHPHEDYT